LEGFIRCSNWDWINGPALGGMGENLYAIARSALGDFHSFVETAGDGLMGT
jgi:hypothetical protein